MSSIPAGPSAIPGTWEGGARPELSRYLFALVALLPPLLAAALGWYRSVQLAISLDEFATAMFSSRTWANLWASLSHVDAIVGPYYAVTHVLAPPLADGAWIRWPSVVATMGTVAVVEVIANRWWGRIAALIAGALLALNPLVLYMASLARPYALATFFLALAVLFVDRALTRSRTVDWVFYALAAAAAGLMHPFALLAVAPTAILALGRSKRALVSWAVSTLVPVVCLIPILAAASGQRGQVSWIAHLSPREALAALAEVVAMQTDGKKSLVDYAALAVLVLCAVVGPGALALRQWRQGDRLAMIRVAAISVIFVGPWLVLYVVSLVSAPLLNFKYLTWSTIGAVLLMSYFLAAMLTKGTIFKVGVLIATVVLLADYALSDYGLMRQAALVPDFLSAATEIRASAHVGDLLVVAQPYYSGGLAYGIAVNLQDDQYASDVLGRLAVGSQPALEVRVITSIEPFRSISLQSPIAQSTVAWFFPFTEAPTSLTAGSPGTEFTCSPVGSARLGDDIARLVRASCVPS